MYYCQAELHYGQLRGEIIRFLLSDEAVVCNNYLDFIFSFSGLGRGYAESDDHARRRIHSNQAIEHQILTDSPHFQRRFNGTIRNRQHQHQQHQLQKHQRRGKSWREEGKELDRDDEEEDEEFLEDEELDFNRFDGPDDAAYDWSEGPDYPPSAHFRNRRMRHSDPVDRVAKSIDFPGRRSGGGMERNYRTRRPDRRGSKRGRISSSSTIHLICSEKSVQVA